MSSRIIQGTGNQFPGQEISWAGYCPWTNNACFGTEQGNLFLIPPEPFNPDVGISGREIFIDEAINGVAFAGDLLAISSRSEVIVGVRRSTDGSDLGRLMPSYKGGSHGILSSAAGGFIAPMGRGGLLFADFTQGKINFKCGTIDGEIVNFYKLASLGLGDNGEVFACAARGSGLLVITVRDGRVSSPIVGHQFPEIDIVDVCSLKSPTGSCAAVALNSDNSLLLSENLLANRKPIAVNFNGIEGTPYSVMSSQGHVFLLTSKELVVFPNLAADFLRGEPLIRDRVVSKMPVEAFDAFLSEDDKVYVIEGEVAISHTIAELIAGVNQSIGTFHHSRHGIIRMHQYYSQSLMPSVSTPIWELSQSRLVTMAA